MSNPDQIKATALAAALYIAQYAYKQAITSPNPARRLDDMCDAMAEPCNDMPKFAAADLEFAETMRAAAADRIWAYTAVEHARAQAPGYGYVFDLLADCLKAGADPAAVRADTHRITTQLAGGAR